VVIKISGTTAMRDNKQTKTLILYWCNATLMVCHIVLCTKWTLPLFFCTLPFKILGSIIFFY